MNEFDQYVKHNLKEEYYIRYADDFVFICKDEKHLKPLRQKCSAFLTLNLKLNLHPNKCFIKTIYSGIDFLGWIHFPKYRVLRTTTKRRIFKKVNENNISSYVGLLRHGDSFEIEEKIRSKLLFSQ